LADFGCVIRARKVRQIRRVVHLDGWIADGHLDV
jgi:hypothetical protein